MKETTSLFLYQTEMPMQKKRLKRRKRKMTKKAKIIKLVREKRRMKIGSKWTIRQKALILHRP